MATPSVRDRVLGSVIGSAVGDALGVVAETKHYDEVIRKYGDFRGFSDLEALGARGNQLGQVTDDTVLSDLLMDCIIRHRGIVDAHLFAAEWERFEEPVDNPGGKPVVRLDRVHWIERIPYYRNRLREIPKR